ncbi:hypothetical protein Q5752_000468 [Cryptotrichosporon argae]
MAARPGNKLAPPWLTDAVRSRRAWKTFVRVMCATFVGFVLLVDQRTLIAFGNAAFFSLIAAAILPPNMPTVIYIFAVLITLIGLCTGWAWGVAAMAAALQVRSSARLEGALRSVESSIPAGESATTALQLAVFEGAFLDPASSAVFGVFIFFGGYFFGWARATKPKLIMFALFGTIGLDVMCTYGPLFPTKQYTLLKIIIYPALAQFGVAIACTLFIFPQSLSHLLVGTLTAKVLAPTLQMLELQAAVLSANPADKEAWTALADKAFALREMTAAAVGGIMGQKKMLQLEITRGRLGPAEVGDVIDRAKDLAARAFPLASLVRIEEEAHQARQNAYAEGHDPHPRADKVLKEMEAHQAAAPARSLEALLPALEVSTAELRAAATETFKLSIEWLDDVNRSRWRRSKTGTSTDEREAALTRLRAVLVEFRASKHFELLAPFEDMFDPTNGHLRAAELPHITASTRALFRCYLFSSSLINFALALDGFAAHLLALDKAHRRARAQWPTKFARAVVRSANDKSGGTNPVDLGVKGPTPDDDSEETLVAHEPKKRKAYSMNPDAGPPTTILHRVGRRLASLWRHLASNEGVFALKYGLISVALFVPSVCPSSAHFYYANKGLWALIMGQFGLGVYTGEQVLNYGIRLAGTLSGCVLGIVIWYIGDAKGDGNPYGFVAAAMVFLAPFIFLRINVPIQHMAFFLMTVVTASLILGYGWLDEHTVQAASVGKGGDTAGRRALLVLIGLTAAFLLMVFPRPTSAKALVRKQLARNMDALSDLYGREITGLDEASRAKTVDTEARRQAFRTHFIAIFGRLQGMKPHLKYAQLEPGLSGPWPKKLYNELYAVQNQMLGALAVLATSISALEPEWATRLMTRSDLLQPAFIADCLALFSILQNALRTGLPLPPAMPLFERLAYHHQRGRLHAASEALARLERGASCETAADSPAMNGEPRAGSDKGASGNAETQVERAREHADASEAADVGVLVGREKQVAKVLAGTLTWQNVQTEQFAIFATAIVALVHVTAELAEMQRIVGALVGSRSIDGYDRMQERWAADEG